ncbi:oxidase [Candidatus Paracaedimonas acanthamoebae]|nr:oxidase [Candidatus Paracaedimonas acanthamoebae]
MLMTQLYPLKVHRKPKTIQDRIALCIVKFMRLFADAFFKKRYGHRAVVLETVAAIPGMIAGMLRHLRSLRKIEDDHGWIKELLDEAENERMHLMTFIHIAQPSTLERLLIIAAQGIFYTLYLILYICSARTAHRLVGYLEEEAVVSYTQYLKEVEEGRMANCEIPQIARGYWNLSPTARLKDLIVVIRNDECKHRDVNHQFSDMLTIE